MSGPGNDLLNHFSGPFACSAGRQLADQRSDSRLRPDVRVIDLLFSSPSRRATGRRALARLDAAYQPAHHRCPAATARVGAPRLAQLRRCVVGGSVWRARRVESPFRPIGAFERPVPRPAGLAENRFDLVRARWLAWWEPSQRLERRNSAPSPFAPTRLQRGQVSVPVADAMLQHPPGSPPWLSLAAMGHFVGWRMQPGTTA